MSRDVFDAALPAALVLEDRKATTVTTNEPEQQPNLVWGAKEIGKVIGRTAEQVRRLHGAGFFRGAVWKAGHRTLVGHRGRLQSLGNV